MYVSSVCLSWPHFVQQNLLPTLTVAACFRGSIFCVESFRLCLFRETYKKLFLVLILFMKYIYIFFLIGTYRLCLYPRGGEGGLILQFILWYHSEFVIWSWNSKGIENTSMNNCFSAPHVDCNYWQFGTKSCKRVVAARLEVLWNLSMEGEKRRGKNNTNYGL